MPSWPSSSESTLISAILSLTEEHEEEDSLAAACMLAVLISSASSGGSSQRAIRERWGVGGPEGQGGVKSPLLMTCVTRPKLTFLDGLLSSMA